MNRLDRCAPRVALAGLLAALLAGCPIPQLLPEYPTGTIAPPRILSDQVLPVDTIILVSPSCATSPAFSLFVSLVHEDTLEMVEARWFVDYDPARSTKVPYRTLFIEGPTDGITITRPVVPKDSPPGTPSFVFEPYDFYDQAFRDGGGLHVVELVVSNGFAAEPAFGQPPLPRPGRTPSFNPVTQVQYETQVHRWVFHYVPAAAGGACGFPAP